MPSKRTSGRKQPASLARYQQKRDFTQTAEPSGRLPVAPADRARFVIQKHAATRLHFDLRLEIDGVFKSWAVTKTPSLDPAVKRLAVEVEDHPLDYGDFEGTIPKGQYGGGTVQLWDRGYWQPEGGKSPQDALASGDLKFTLQGERLSGSWVLVRMKHDRNGSKHTNWLLIKHRDAAAQTDDGDLEIDRSVASGRTMEQIAAGKGKSPTPFMLAKDRMKADAVWQSNKEDKTRSVLRAAAAPGASKSARKRASASPVTMPDFVAPQLCQLVDRPSAEAGWAHEVKFDGYRAQLRVAESEARIRTRRGLDWTAQFRAIAESAGVLPDCIIDGEICALDHQQMPSFAALQTALSENRSENLVLFAFDLLFDGGEDLRKTPLSERKERLRVLLEKADAGASIRYVQHFESTADTVLLSACKMQLEGIVSKRLDAKYTSGRSASWTKAKCRAGHEVVLGGYTHEGGRLRSLLAGVNRGGHLVYIGRIGTGYSEKTAADLRPTLEKWIRKESPFEGDNAPKAETNVRWLKPTLVAEIEFAGWTASGMIRQAAFKGLRRDKPAREVVAELPSPVDPQTPEPDERLAAKAKQTAASAVRKHRPPRTLRTTASYPGDSGEPGAAVLGVPISKPDKVFWPDAGDDTPVTKLDLAHYYEAVGDWMMPHLKGRPASLLRAPDGIGGSQQFFQRHAMPGMSNLFTMAKVRGDRQAYVQIDRVEAIIAAAQFGALEIHPWNCAPNEIEVAGRLVFDLDPAPDVRFPAVVTAALEIRDRLAKLGLESFCKTTGGKGLHVVVPLMGGKDAVKWPTAKDFAHAVCAQMAEDSPRLYLDTMAKKDRTGRIFLDYLRNDRTATAVAVLSSRARSGATVSMPVEWSAVKPTLNPFDFTVRSAPKTLEKTKPWSGYDKGARSLLAAVRKITAA